MSSGIAGLQMVLPTPGLAAVLAAGNSAPDNPLSAETVAASGLTGATAAMRFVGATTSGAPASGTFAVGDVSIDQSGKIWVCTAAGTPGTWTEIGSSSGGGGLTLIKDVLLTATTASITFSSIPGTYKTLILDLYGAVTTTGVSDEPIYLTFNADGGANYDYLAQLGVTNAGGLSSQAYGATQISLVNLPGGNAPAGSAGSVYVRIPNYAGTTFWKTLVATGGDHWGTSNNTVLDLLGDWHSTSAITEIGLAPESGSFSAGTRATLWGAS